MPSLKKTALGLLLLLILCIGWLVWENRTAAIPGHYVATGSWGTSTLDLNSDSTFIQSVTLPGFPKDQLVTGKWEVTGPTRYFVSRPIALRSVIDFSQTQLEKGSKHNLYTYVECSGVGPMRIDINSASGATYYKVR
jgi:hypothetical protein